MRKRGTPSPINGALNRSRTKLGLDLGTWMVIVFVSITVFLVGLRLIAVASIPDHLSEPHGSSPASTPKCFSFGVTASSRRATMTRVNTEQSRLMPWYAKAGAASSIIPLSRWIAPNIFAMKNGGYGFVASLTGMDEESLTDQELESRTRTVMGALRGLPGDSCLYQYSRVLSGYEIPRKPNYGDPVLDSFVDDRLDFLNANAGFRKIDLFWVLTIEPDQKNPLDRKPKDAAADEHPPSRYIAQNRHHP